MRISVTAFSPGRLLRLCLGMLAFLVSVCALPSAGHAAASCSASNMSQYMAFDGTPTWANFSTFVGCSDPSTTGAFVICSAPAQQGGTGGTSITPYRRLAGPSTSLEWQFFDGARSTPVTGSGVQLGTIDFANPYFGSTQLAYSAHIPVNASLVNGTYSTTLLMPLELRQGSCSGPLEASFTFSFTLDVGVSTYCQINGTQAVSFGSGRATTTQMVDATGAITVQCYWGSFSISLSDGQHASGTQRHVSNGTDLLAYDIYTAPDRLVPWRGSTSMTATSNGEPTTLFLYGRMPGQPTPSAGHYTDVIIASVVF